ncbi:uncharacterized protein Brd2l isoform X2 [Rattus norvegicus]|uniref:uncharacterized protein Brd2l isoform X2 n=1 Tax=Rattus norvegicus TaxID=10116 RepID=UPI002FD7A817
MPSHLAPDSCTPPQGTMARETRHPRPFALQWVRRHEVGHSPPPQVALSGWPQSTLPLAVRCLKDKSFPLGIFLLNPKNSSHSPPLLMYLNDRRRPRPRGPCSPGSRSHGGALESRPQPGWGGARNPGCQPPRKPRRRWGRGRSPQPLPSLAAGGGGKHRGRAATSAALGLAGPGHVSAPPTATRARFPNTAEGRVRGHRGCTAQTCVPRPQTSPRLLPRQVPGLPRGRGRPRPPHSPLEDALDLLRSLIHVFLESGHQDIGYRLLDRMNLNPMTTTLDVQPAPVTCISMCGSITTRGRRSS